MDNTAVNLEPQTESSEVETEVSVFSKAAQALSNPINMTEYIADKAITGVVTSLCYIGITKGIEKVKEARALKNASMEEK